MRLGIAAGAGLAGGVMIARAWAGVWRDRPDAIRELTRSLTRCKGLSEILRVVERSFTSVSGFPSAIFIPEGERLSVRHYSSGFDPDRNDAYNARLSIATGNAVTDIPASRDVFTHFLPLSSWRGAVGAFAFRAGGTRRRLGRRMWRLAESFADQASLAVMRSTLEDKARQAEFLAEADRLQKALLNSIAHNVRSPLASIIGVLSTLQDGEISLAPPVRRDLIDTAREEAQRLNRLLGNLLDLSRLEAGVLQIRKDPCDVQDVIGAALEQLGSAIEHRAIEVRIAPEVPFVPMDFVLIVQVLVNLLDNAIKYSPAGPSITVDARLLSGNLEICVGDCGDGIAEDDLAHVFEKFNRGGRSGETGGIGLGLSICKGLIEAHHGSIRAERRRPCGTSVRFTLPLQQSRPDGRPSSERANPGG